MARIPAWLYSAFVPLLLVAVVGWMLFGVIRTIDHYNRQVSIFGPDPAYVEYETSHGISGQMLVRDRNNAEAEIRAHISELWGMLESSDRIQVESNTQDYAFTKFRFKEE